MTHALTRPYKLSPVHVLTDGRNSKFPFSQLRASAARRAAWRGRGKDYSDDACSNQAV